MAKKRYSNRYAKPLDGVLYYGSKFYRPSPPWVVEPRDIRYFLDMKDLFVAAAKAYMSELLTMSDADKMLEEAQRNG